jgi:hypothetical protein
MRWRKFNGDPISLPIKDAVEEAIKKETAKKTHLYWYRQPGER